MEVQGSTIDAISETSWFRTVVKHVTKMSGTSGTQDLGDRHHLSSVHVPGDVVLILVVDVWLVSVKEGQPAKSGVILVLAVEQLHVAADTRVHPCLLVLVVVPGPDILRDSFSCYLILDIAQDLSVCTLFWALYTL